MRKYAFMILCLALVSACDKHDPILPGVRTEIFNTSNMKVLNTPVENLPDAAQTRAAADCKYTIDSTNTIRDDSGRKIFVGFPSPNSVDIETKPLCDGGHVYAGLNTGNVVKLAPKNRNIVWMTDVFAESNMTGGATTVDIVAPLVVDNGYVYAGGMGDAFCKINASTGNKKWCVTIGTRFPFIVLQNVAYVMGMDDVLYAVRTSDGAIYWHTDAIKKPLAPTYENQIIHVGKKLFNAATGDEIK
mgnify:CR=1 FL=1